MRCDAGLEWSKCFSKAALSLVLARCWALGTEAVSEKVRDTFALEPGFLIDTSALAAAGLGMLLLWVKCLFFLCCSACP